MKADVAIVGGGPAGTAAALTLAHHSTLKTVVLERGDYSEVRIGETVGPGVMPLLHYLGVDDRVKEGEHLCSLSQAAAWGSETVYTYDFLFSGRGDGWQLDRNKFDSMLAEAAVEAGAIVRTRMRLREVVPDGNSGWRLTAESADGASTTITAEFLIDASGRAATVARSAGSEPRPIDLLVGTVAYICFDDDRRQDKSYTFVESVPEGWWYSTWLPGDILAVALMSDADLIRPILAQGVVGWTRLLSEAPYTRARVVGGRRPQRLFTRPAFSHLLHPAGGNRWLSAGDALSAFDPLSSMGIGHSLASGSHAARAVEAYLRGDFDPGIEYINNSTKHFADFLAIRSRYYRMEQRWPSRPFWQRRHGSDKE